MSIGVRGEIIVDLLSYAKDGASKGCLMAMADTEFSQKITNFSKSNISDDNLADDGRETEPHITILYGFSPDFNENSLQNILNDFDGLYLELGLISRFECPEYDVVKAEINSSKLHELHYLIKNKFNDSINSSYPIYHPHLTLAYIKKGSHKELDGHTGLAGQSFSVNSLCYSSPDKRRKILNLGKFK